MGRRKQNFHRLSNPGSEYKKQYQELRAKGLSKHNSNQYARMIITGKKSFTEVEQKFMEDHPEYEDKVSEDVQDVKGYTDFTIIEDEPFLEIEWKRSLQHLAFCNIDIAQTRSSFRKAENRKNFDKLMSFLNRDDNLIKYGANIYHPVFEKLLADTDSEGPESEEEPKPEEDPNPRGKSPRKAPRKHPRSHYLVGPPIP